MEPIYLDNASTSFPKPPQVAQAMFDYVTGCGCNIGRGGDIARLPEICALAHSGQP